MTYLSSQFDPVLRKKIKSKVAVIPVGSIEQHGAHLPISTDSDIVSEVARRISDKENYLLLPTLSYGVSFEHSPYINLSIRETTLKTILTDLCESLLSNGVKKILIINGHHGNQKSLLKLEKSINQKLRNRLKLFIFSYWHFMDRDFDHAGFVETSLMLAISKNVKMDSAKKGLVTDRLTKQQIKNLGKLASISFPKVTKNGVWGDPRKATKKEGQKILTEIVQNLQKMCQTCLTERGS